MINKLKNYFAGLNKQSVVTGLILVMTFTMAAVSASGLSLLGAGAMFMFAGILFYKKFNLNEEGFGISKRVLLPAVFLIIVSGLSIITAQNYFLAFRAFLTIIVLFSVIVSVRNVSKTEFSIGVSAISIITFLYSIYEYFTTTSTTVIRLEGFAGYANTFGLYATVFGLIATYYASFANKTRSRWFMFMVAAMDFFVAFMTLSRGVLLAVIVSAIFVGVLFYKKINFKSVLKNTGIIITIGSIIVFAVTTIKKNTSHEKIILVRTDSTLVQTSGTRLQHFQTALRMFNDHKFGVGAGNYPQMSFDYEIKPIDNAIDPHSFVMTLLAEYGVLIVFWIYLLFEIIRCVIVNRNSFDQEKIFYLFVSVAFLLHICIDSDMRQPFSWLILAIILGKLLNLKESFKLNRINIVKNIFVVILLIPAMLMLLASALLINFYDTSGTYSELEIRDHYVLFAANLVQIQPDIWENSAKMALAKSLAAKNPEDIKNSVQDLIYRSNRAMAITGPQPRHYSLMARGYAALREEANYRQALEKSVSLSRYHNYNERAALAGYYIYTKEYNKLKDLVMSTYYLNKDYFGSAYAESDPEKNKKYTAMNSMLEVLKTQSLENKDKETYLLTSKILTDIGSVTR